MTDLADVVWRVVRDRPARGGLPVDQIPHRIHASTGRDVTHAQVWAAVLGLVAEGRLYWRDQRRPRRLLHVEATSQPDQPAPPPTLPGMG